MKPLDSEDRSPRKRARGACFSTAESIVNSLLKPVALAAVLFVASASAEVTAEWPTKLFAYPIGSLGGSPTVGTAINESGQIAGYGPLAGGYPTRAFITGPNGVGIRDLGTLVDELGNVYDNLSATALNDAGEVVGFVEDGTGEAFVTDANGTNLRQLEGFPWYASQRMPYGINASGRIVGFYHRSIDGVGQFEVAFATDASARRFTSFDQLPGRQQSNSLAYAVNDAGQIAISANDGSTDQYGRRFSRCFIGDLESGELEELNAPFESNCTPFSISSSGMMTGYLVDDSGSRREQAFATGKSGHRLAVIPSLGGDYNGGDSISAVGDLIVGYSTASPDSSRVAAAWVRGRAPVDLNRVVINMPPGVRLEEAHGVNSNGQIVAKASDQRSYILCPRERCRPQ